MDLSVTGDGLIALIGSILGFIGVIITILHTKNNLKKTKE